MTSEARKQAWLAGMGHPVPDTGYGGWAYIWRISRTIGVGREYCLALIERDRSLQVYFKSANHKQGTSYVRADHIAPLLKTLLSPEQLAAGLAAIITRNHANTGDPP